MWYRVIYANLLTNRTNIRNNERCLDISSTAMSMKMRPREVAIDVTDSFLSMHVDTRRRISHLETN